VGVLGELATHHGIEVDHGDRNCRPAEQLRGAQPALTGDEPSIGADDDGLQQPEFGHAGGEGGDVAHVSTMANTDDNVCDCPRGSSEARCDFHSLEVVEAVAWRAECRLVALAIDGNGATLSFCAAAPRLQAV
jgi:hypothetical protein